MKKVKLFLVMSVAAVIGFTACEESENLSVKTIEGIYEGTLTTETNQKSAVSFSNDVQNATAEVTDMGNGQIEVHCYSEDMDTTFVLNHYNNNDSVMVCLNGEAFEEMYGHMMGHGNSSGGMMGGMNNSNSEWMNHMNMEHENGDEHFGGFDMTNMTFGYTITSNKGDYHFQGTKKEMGM